MQWKWLRFIGHFESGPVLSASRVLTQILTVTPKGLELWRPPNLQAHGYAKWWTSLLHVTQPRRSIISILTRSGFSTHTMNSKHWQERCYSCRSRGPWGGKRSYGTREGREGTSTHLEFFFFSRKKTEIQKTVLDGGNMYIESFCVVFCHFKKCLLTGEKNPNKG